MSNLRLFRTLVKDGERRYIVVKDGVFFGLNDADLNRMKTIIQDIWDAQENGQDVGNLCSDNE